jgi:hypothetical protein
MNDKIDKRFFLLGCRVSFQATIFETCTFQLASLFATVIDRRYREDDEVA